MTDDMMDRLEDLVLILRNENGSLPDDVRDDLVRERAVLESQMDDAYESIARVMAFK